MISVFLVDYCHKIAILFVIVYIEVYNEDIVCRQSSVLVLAGKLLNCFIAWDEINVCFGDRIARFL